ncbi:type II toxin-antitoxin system RelE/ParE family toxin [Variovorax sp. JS1663]|uniref:type II toxin-antitoxin system RelE/ParE family toxin n=1 Tax=Variovorax sp. JS1663 TaxID=1851577 RepID=UPI000B348D80|nr:type II toxin-antitoxin system RelE/ParE family toxin [Variovorax sp. JS1663]
MLRYRLSEAAQGDVLSILGWTHDQFGEAARLRYESLIVAALRDVASEPDRPGSLPRAELGAGVRSWHLRLSRNRVNPDVAIVRRPRHFLVYRSEPSLVIVGRVLHDAIELARHLDPDTSWT